MCSKLELNRFVAHSSSEDILQSVDEDKLHASSSGVVGFNLISFLVICFAFCIAYSVMCNIGVDSMISDALGLRATSKLIGKSSIRS